MMWRRRPNQSLNPSGPKRETCWFIPSSLARSAAGGRQALILKPDAPLHKNSFDFQILCVAMDQITGGEPNLIDRTGLCLLSLDGGGVRGLSSLYVLKAIMSRLNSVRRVAGLPVVKPCEIFDLIGGTSTGA